MDNDQLRYSTVHFDVRKKLDISFPDYILLDMIYILSGKYGKCYKSTSALASDMGLSFNGVKKMIQRLVDRELIITDGHTLQVTQAFMDVAYFNKTGRVSEIAQSSIDKSENIVKSQKLHKVQKPAKDNRGEAQKDGITSEIAQSGSKLHKVHKIAQSSDKNKHRTKKNNKHIPIEARNLETALYLSVKRNFPNLQVKDPQGSWAEDIEKIHRIDGYSWEKIVAVAKWSQEDNFWQQNIRSGKKLREKFDTLMVRVTSGNGRAPKVVKI